MTKRLRFLAAALMAAFAFSSAPASAGGTEVHVMGAWVRDVPPTMKMTAGYMTVMNHGEKARALVGVTSPDYDRVEMHISRITDGVATMHEAKQIDLPAGGDLSFAPGGMHLMLIRPKAGTADKAEVSLTLEFADGMTIDLMAPVRKSAGDGMPMHNHSHTSPGS